MNKKVALSALMSVLLSTALSLCVVGLLEVQIAHASPYTNIDVDTAYNMITNGSYPDLIVLDVRAQSEYDSGHIRNAILIPLGQLESRLDELDKEKDTLVYCRSGVRSASACETLDANGFTSVYNMEGGILAWQSAGYPVYVRYLSIQEAINNANNGDSLLVSSGTYYEHVVVNKTVNLVGENSETTIIDGNGTQTVLEIVKLNVNVTEFTIQNGAEGVYLTEHTNSCIITDCKIVNNGLGIFVNASNNNLLTGNIIANNSESGIKIYALCACSPVQGNIVTENKVLNNNYGIQLINSLGSMVYHNNFVKNTPQVYTFGLDNTWDDGYPSGGNYWSGHNPPDLYSGPYQNETGGDEIGDTPYVMDENNVDRYPLIYPYGYVPSPDANDDGIIDIMDVLIVGLAFGSQPGDPNWDPIADLAEEWGLIDIMDILVIAVHFGETW